MAGGLIDPSLVSGWTNQTASGNLYGIAGVGYGTNTPNAGAVTFNAPAGQGAGGALDGTGPYVGYGLFDQPGNAVASALTNAGYADSYPGDMIPGMQLTTPPTLVAATRIKNPSGLNMSVALTGTTGNVYVGPANAAGSGTTNLSLMGSAAGTYVVPPGGFLYVTTVSGVTATWTVSL